MNDQVLFCVSCGMRETDGHRQDCPVAKGLPVEIIPVPLSSPAGHVFETNYRYKQMEPYSIFSKYGKVSNSFDVATRKMVIRPQYDDSVFSGEDWNLLSQAGFQRQDDGSWFRIEGK